MSVKIELPPEIEANLAAQAAAQGIPLPEYLRHVLEEQASAGAGNSLLPEERATVWRESVRACRDTKPGFRKRRSAERASSCRG